MIFCDKKNCSHYSFHYIWEGICSFDSIRIKKGKCFNYAKLCKRIETLASESAPVTDRREVHK